MSIVHDLIYNVMCYSKRRPNGQEGFVPVNYVKEVEPAVIRNITKKKVTKLVTVTVKKKKTEQRKVAKRRSAAISMYYDMHTHNQKLLLHLYH